MKRLERKLCVLERIKEQLHHEIWDGFDEYIKANKINFNGPEDWEFSSYGEGGKGSITFSGTDGCRGCYDPMSLTIPLLWFTDREKALEQKAAEDAIAKAKEDERKAKEKAVQENLEHQTFLRLQAKYANTMKFVP